MIHEVFCIDIIVINEMFRRFPVNLHRDSILPKLKFPIVYSIEKIRVCNLKNLYIVNFSLESTLTIIINIYTTNEIPIRMYLNTNANFSISKDISVIFYLNYVYCVNLKKRYIFIIMEFTIEDK